MKNPHVMQVLKPQVDMWVRITQSLDDDDLLAFMNAASKEAHKRACAAEAMKAGRLS
jgi:hypothetical protein